MRLINCKIQHSGDTIPSEDQMQWLVLKYRKCPPPHMPAEHAAAFQLSGKTSLSLQVWLHTASYNSEVNSQDSLQIKIQRSG